MKSVVLFGDNYPEQLKSEIERRYIVIPARTVDAASFHSQEAEIVLVTSGHNSDVAIDCCQRIMSDHPGASVILYCETDSLSLRIAGLEAGCVDVIPTGTPVAEIHARLENVILHAIANRQLMEQVCTANQIAMQAMTNTSDLGTNIQFLLDCVSCNNYDEVGMRLFQTLRYYNLQCSLQIRGGQETKNMESNGMAKELESQLLFELKDHGRYIDFGKRTIVNYGQLSLLIRNMPLNNPEKYGQIKDNTFALLQGADSRISALDTLYSLERERDFMEKITMRMQLLIENIEESNQQIIKGCASVVEDLITDVESSLAVLGLTEHQEETFLSIMHKGLERINNQVSLGLRVDESFRRLLMHIQDSLKKG